MTKLEAAKQQELVAQAHLVCLFANSMENGGERERKNRMQVGESGQWIRIIKE